MTAVHGRGFYEWGSGVGGWGAGWACVYGGHWVCFPNIRLVVCLLLLGRLFVVVDRSVYLSVVDFLHCLFFFFYFISISRSRLIFSFILCHSIFFPPSSAASSPLSLLHLSLRLSSLLLPYLLLLPLPVFRLPLLLSLHLRFLLLPRHVHE